jgi:dCTP deaminase
MLSKRFSDDEKLQKHMITPFHERARYEGMTYGLSSAGYDVRIGEPVTVWSGRTTLASTIERFNMPSDVLAQVCDKSSWARQGLVVQNTIIEPGWRGHLTLELTYTPLDDSEEMFIEAGSPIAQIIFMRLEEPTEQPYSGKYQDQEAGTQPARFDR